MTDSGLIGGPGLIGGGLIGSQIIGHDPSTVATPVETITWIDPDGGETDLVDITGITGRGLPPIDLNDLVVPLQPGSTFRSVRDTARQIVVPILVSAATKIDYRAQLRTLAAKLHPSARPGILRAATITGDRRELLCWCVDGFAWNEEHPDWMTPSVVFRACDPYWYDGSDTEVDVTGQSGATFFPLFPLRLSSSEIFASGTVDNSGDVDAWPVWTVIGPGSDLTLTNLTTDRQLTVTADLDAGGRMTIDTRPGYKSVTLQDGTNLFGSLSGSLWPLTPAGNSLQAELTATSADTRISGRYKRRYLVA